jgi:hypothetical protein
MFRGGGRTLQVIERPTALPRVHLVSNWDMRASPEAARSWLETRVLPRNFAVVEPTALLNGRAVRTSVPAPLPSAPAGDVTAIDYRLTSIRADTESPSPNLLVVADTWYPGWRATVDGQEAAIFRVNGTFRGVLVPAGRHHVGMTYVPNGLRLGGGLSAIGLVIVAVGWITGRRTLATVPSERDAPQTAVSRRGACKALQRQPKTMTGRPGRRRRSR